MKFEKIKYSAIIGIYILTPLVLISIPTIAFENTPSICLIKFFSGFDCLGCGMIRALSSVFHFEFKKAIEFNSLVVVVFPILTYLYIKQFFILSKKVF